VSTKTLVVSVFSLFLVLSSSCHDNNGGNPVQQNGNKKAYGVFEVFLDPAERKTSMLGALYDGPAPIVGYDTVMASGECVLIKPRNPKCDNCLGGSVCVNDNDCKPEPDTMTVGTVTVNGLKTKDSLTTFTMPPLNGNYQPINNLIRLAYPSCTENGTVTLTAQGTDSTPEFTLTTKGIAPIVTPDDSLPMDSGKSIDLKWTAPATPGNSKILMSIDITYHGGTKAKVESTSPDDGELIIPAALLDSLKTFGISGHPKLELNRISIATDPSTGVQLRLVSQKKIWLKIPGIISCSEDSQCPDGQECAGDQRCRAKAAQ
jgi:hypothetical protein